ncbi:MAG: hypothetical protein HEEMFOPI_01337 [Holosporales bacterium]
MVRIKIRNLGFCALAAVGIAEAKINVGVVLQGNFLKPKTTFFGTDLSGVTPLDFSQDIGQTMNALGGGFLLGYESETEKALKMLFDVDVQLFNKSTNIGSLKGVPSSAGLDNESFAFRKKMEVGFTSSFAYAINKKLDVLFGVRFNGGQYKLDIKTGAGSTGITSVPSDTFWTMGVEPNIGARYKINEKAAVRFSLGYNFAQKYTKVDYAGSVQNQVSGDVSFQPNGVAARVALTWGFN